MAMATLRMLCRALLAAAILSYVLCVLLLSGVQKEDLDAGTLRKLQRHNVNIDDINDPKLQENCLGEDNASTISTTLPPLSFEETVQEKTITAKDIPIKIKKNTGTDTTALQRILEYFKNKHKAEYNGDSESKNKTKISAQDISSLMTTSPQSISSFCHEETVKIMSTTEKILVTITNKEDKTHDNVLVTRDLEKLMKIWQSNMDKISDTIQQQSTTLKTIKDDSVSQNAKDIEYISKIVTKIMSSKRLQEENTTSSEHIVKETPRHADEISPPQTVKKAIFPTNYYLNNCKLGTSNRQDVMPIADNKTSNDNFICTRVESSDKQMVNTDRVNENTINYILTKLKGENPKVHVQLPNPPKKIFLNRQNEHINDNYKKETLNVLDNESAKALETVLENQSNKVMFSQLREPINASRIQEILNPLDIIRNKELESASSSVQYVTPIHTAKIQNEKQDDYARFMEESKRVWEKYFKGQSTRAPKLKKGRTLTVLIPPYKTSNQDVQRVDDEYKKVRYTYPNQLNTQRLMAEAKINSLLNNMADDHRKLTQTQNSVQYNPDMDKQYKSPWFYDTLRNERFENNNKEILDRLLFKPENADKIPNTIDTRLENTYRHIRPPYFEPLNKNMSIVPTKGHDSYKKAIWFKNDIPLKQPNDRERSHELKDTSKNFVNWYQNKTPFTIADKSLKQVDPNGDRIFNEVRSQTAYYNKIGPDAELKSDWGYIRNKQRTKQNPNMKEYDEETEYFINSQIRKNENYQFPPKPYEINAKETSIDDDHTKNNLFKYISIDNLIHNTVNKDTVKLPVFPANVLKDIANSVKEIVLRDLKRTVSTQIKIIPTTTASPTTTITTTLKTTTPKATTTTPTPTAITTMMSATTKHVEPASTITSEERPLKIQDASKALDKIMAIFERINSMKDKIVEIDSMRHNESVRHKITTGRALIIEPPVQDKPENLASHDQFVPWETENGKLYEPQDIQRKPDNLISRNRQPFPRNHNPYVYGMKSPYYHSKIELDSFGENNILNPATSNLKVVPVPRPHVITVQTNAGEIAPLKIAVNKPFLQNIVLTTRAPENDEMLIYRSPTLSPTPRGIDNNKKIQRESKYEQFVPPLQHREVYSDSEMHKDKNIEQESEFPMKHNHRGLPMTEKFHEKLERGEAWPPYNEKIPQRIQQPIGKRSKYNDIHFRNFLHTQQKVNAMLENILNSAKNKPTSGQVI